MPINQPVTYSYRPKYTPKSRMYSYNSFKARLDAGGTFFKALQPGSKGNEISIEFIIDTIDTNKVTLIIDGPFTIKEPTYSGTGDGKLTNVDVPVFPVVFQTVQMIAISSTEFNVTGSVSGDLGVAKVNELFFTDIISFTIIGGSIDFSIGDTFTVILEDPKEEYVSLNNYDPNVPTIETDPNTGLDVEVWPDPLEPSPAYNELRNLVNGNSKFLEMPIRGYDYVDQQGTISTRNQGDNPLDDPLIVDTPKTNLFGGQGFPSNPGGISTGTERSLIHINRGENPNGTIREINKVYEWTGSSLRSGTFTKYV